MQPMKRGRSELEPDCGDAHVAVPTTTAAAATAAAAGAETTPAGGNDASGTDLSRTAFRLAEKRYKLFVPDKRARDNRREPCAATDFSDVVDFRTLANNSVDNLRHVVRLGGADADGVEEGGPRAFVFSKVPGLVFFPNALSVETQRTLARNALVDFSRSPPYPNNLTTLDPAATTSGYVPGMRWATLGRTYNWTTKSYEGGLGSPFPSDLADLVAGFVRRAAHVGGLPSTLAEGFRAQTAIVNYFPVRSMMCAHQDVSEVALERPLVSMSTGSSAIFLMGTESRDDAPTAFFIRSGDVVVFAGPSRRAFHAVPRILEDCPDYLLDIGESSETRAAAGDASLCAVEPVMRGLRININVRQVTELEPSQ